MDHHAVHLPRISRPAARTVALSTTIASLTLAFLLLMPAGAWAATLSERVAAQVARSPLRGRTSVVAWDQSTRDIFYTRSADTPIAPASNMKLLTSAAVMQRFGPDHTFTTRLALTGHKEGSTWVGSAYLIGGGDPTLSTRSFAIDNMDGVGASIGALVGPLSRRGVTRITGRLYVVESYLDSQRWNPAWKHSFRYTEVPAMSALSVNQSHTHRWIDDTSSHTPALYAGTIYRTLLSRSGITIAGGTIVSTVPPDAEVVGTLESPRLELILRHMNKQSDNYYAEILLKDLGRDVYGAGKGSTTNGARAARLQLRSIGVPIEAITWRDGSGLAYGNRVTARVIANTLGVGAQADWADAWTGSFAVAGGSGTLQHRMTSSSYRGNVRGKTGTLRHVSALSGFSTRASGRDYGFVVVTYRSDLGSIDVTAARGLQDRVAMTLVR